MSVAFLRGFVGTSDERRKGENCTYRHESSKDYRYDVDTENLVEIYNVSPPLPGDQRASSSRLNKPSPMPSPRDSAMKANVEDA